MDNLYRKLWNSKIWEKTHFTPHDLLSFNNVAKISRLSKDISTLFNLFIYANCIYPFPLKRVILSLERYYTDSKLQKYDEDHELDKFAFISTVCILQVIYRSLATVAPSTSFLHETNGLAGEIEIEYDFSNVLIRDGLAFAVTAEQDYNVVHKEYDRNLKKLLNLSNQQYEIPLRVKTVNGAYVFSIRLDAFDEYKEDIENRINYNLEFQKDADSFDLKDPLKGLF